MNMRAKLMWKDRWGKNLYPGDMIEDTERRAIGRVVVVCGLPCIRMMKQFSRQLMGYEPIEYKGPEEAYIRPLVKRRSKIGWWLRGYVLSQVEILAHDEERKRRFDTAAAYQRA